jgi:hypothetical protein
MKKERKLIGNGNWFALIGSGSRFSAAEAFRERRKRAVPSSEWVTENHPAGDKRQ